MSREILDGIAERPPEFRQNSLFGGGLSKRARFGLFLFGAFLVLVSLPMSPLMIVIAFWVQHRAKTRQWTRVFPVVLLAVAVLVAVLWGQVWVSWFTATVVDGWNGLWAGESVSEALLKHVSQMVPAWLVSGFVVGLPAGLIYAGWDAFRTPEWRVREKKRTTMQALRMLWHRRLIESGRGRGEGEVVYGLENARHDSGAVVSQTMADMLHTLILGVTGSGKTQTMFRTLFPYIEDHSALFVIDLKGSRTTYETIQAKAKAEDRPFYGFTLNGPLHYDPFRTKAGTDPTKQKDLFISAEEWSEEHYKGLAESFLLTLFKALEIGGPLPGKSVLASCGIFLNEPNELAKYARAHLNKDEHYALQNQVMSRVAEVNKNPQSISGLMTKIGRIVDSVVGEWLAPGPGMFSLREAWDEDAVVVFSLNHMAYPMLSGTVAAFVLQDMKSLAGEIQDMPETERKPWMMAVDEFTKANTTALSDSVTQVREAGGRVVLATQGWAEMVTAGGEPYAKTIWSQSVTKIVHSVDMDTAERFCREAGLKWGTEKSHDTNEQDGLLDIDRGGVQNRGRAKPVKIDRIDPSRFTAFRPGEFAMIGPMRWRANASDGLMDRGLRRKVIKKTLVKQCLTIRESIAVENDEGDTRTVADGDLAEASSESFDYVPDALLTEAEKAERAASASHGADTATEAPKPAEQARQAPVSSAPPPPSKRPTAVQDGPPPPSRRKAYQDTRGGYEKNQRSSDYADEWFDDEP